MKRGYRFSLRLKLVLLTTILALITYSFTALFIYVVYDYIHVYWNFSQPYFVILTLATGAEEVNASIHEQTGTIQNIGNLVEGLEAQAQTLNQQIRQFNVS